MKTIQFLKHISKIYFLAAYLAHLHKSVGTLHTVNGSTHVQECIKLQAINEHYTAGVYHHWYCKIGSA